MNSIIAFLKDIFTLSDDDMKVGLSQYKIAKEPPKTTPKKIITRKHNGGEVRLSDLMRKSC